MFSSNSDTKFGNGSVLVNVYITAIGCDDQSIW